LEILKHHFMVFLVSFLLFVSFWGLTAKMEILVLIEGRSGKMSREQAGCSV